MRRSERATRRTARTVLGTARAASRGSMTEKPALSATYPALTIFEK
jgi:hypothetical protein